MHSPNELRAIINEEFSKLPSDLKPVELYEPIRYFISLGGKRLRPVLLLMGNELFSQNNKDAIMPALGLELFHNFTLLHDDIMDQSPIRRRQPTVNKKWNNNIAILAGDAMFVESCMLMMKSKPQYLQPVMSVFLATAIQVCEGQQYDMNYELESTVSIPEYLNMVELKTAVLLGASLKIGAILGGAAEEDANLLYEFGKNIGIAFQLQDDILDVYGNETIFGKQKGKDIVSNKKTFLLIKALELSKDSSARELNTWINSENFIDKEKVEAVTSIFNRYQVKQLAQDEMSNFFKKGLASLMKVNADSSRKEFISGYAESLMFREN